MSAAQANRYAAKPVPTSGRGAAELESFVTSAPRKTVLPWQNPGVRDDMRMELNTRQSERVMFMIRWVADQEGRPLREVVEQALIEYTEKVARKNGISL